MEKLLLSAAKGELTSSEDLQDIVSNFSDHLDKTDLSKELTLLKNVMTGCEYTYETLRNKISMCFSPGFEVLAAVACHSCYISNK